MAFDKSEGVVKRHFSLAMLCSTALFILMLLRRFGACEANFLSSDGLRLGRGEANFLSGGGLHLRRSLFYKICDRSWLR